MNPSRPRRPSIYDKLHQRRHRPDYLLLLLSVILLAMGLIVVYAISPGLSAQKNVHENYFVTKQLIAIGLGVVGFLAVSGLPLNIWRKLERPLLYGSAASAVAVRFFGEQVNGAYRWIQVGGISFQPAELIKFVLIIWLAGFLADRLRSGELRDYHKTMKPLLIALGCVSVVIAGLQSDLGSAGVMVAIMAAMVFIIGMPLKRIALISAIIAIGGLLFIFGSGYRRERLVTFFNPSQDCLSAGYQSCQALIAVGSGGMFGLGLAKSVQAYGYLPEAANDSIFAIFAEKFGFVGVAVLLILFSLFFARIKNVIDHAPDNYTRLLATGVLAWLSTQTIINIGAMIGLLPLKGITLPFISYGGTSVVFVMCAVGLVFQLSRYTTYSVNTKIQNVEGNRYGLADNRANRRRLRGAYHPNPSGR